MRAQTRGFWSPCPPMWVPIFDVPYKGILGTHLTWVFLIPVIWESCRNPADLRECRRRLGPPAGRIEHGNGDDQRFSRGQLVFEAKFDL